MRVITDKAEAEDALRAGAKLRCEDFLVWWSDDGFRLNYTLPDSDGGRSYVRHFDSWIWSEATFGPFEVLREPGAICDAADARDAERQRYRQTKLHQ